MTWGRKIETNKQNRPITIGEIKLGDQSAHRENGPRQDFPNALVRGINMLRASDVKPEKLAKLWNGRFFLGKLGFIAGEPGLGKSLIGILWRPRCPRGDWPGREGAACRGDVIYITAEDGAADTIRPRLEAARADLHRVHIIESVTDHLGVRPFNLVSDLDRLEQCLQAVRKPRLVIIDPINACLSATYGRSFNANDVAQVRALLRRLEALAIKYRVAIVCITHLTKAKSGSPLSRVAGSFAFVAAARSGFMVVRGKDDPEQRIFMPAKNNLGRDIGALAFRIEERVTTGKISAPYAIFTGDQLIAGRRP
jgi:predicted ATP-dependent serine protease